MMLKLGKKASSFYDPKSQLKITRKEQVVVVNTSKFPLIEARVRGGHLVQATEAELENWKKLEAKERKELEDKLAAREAAKDAPKKAPSKVIEVEDDEDEDENDLSKLTKDELVEKVLEAQTDWEEDEQ